MIPSGAILNSISTTEFKPSVKFRSMLTILNKSEKNCTNVFERTFLYLYGFDLQKVFKHNMFLKTLKNMMTHGGFSIGHCDVTLPSKKFSV